MRRANALASSNLSSYNFNLDLIAQKPKTTNTESIKHKKEDKNLSSAKKRYLAKLMDERFNEFNSGDWIMYFQDAYKEATGENYIVGFYPKAHAIFKRLIKEFTVLEIRNMIDFIFKSNQDIVDKITASPSVLSGNWINTMYVSSKLWVRGKYVPKSKKFSTPKRNREWKKPDTDTTSSDALMSLGNGIEL